MTHDSAAVEALSRALDARGDRLEAEAAIRALNAAGWSIVRLPPPMPPKDFSWYGTAIDDAHAGGFNFCLKQIARLSQAGTP